MVDGRIITAENYDSARAFGQTITEEVIVAGDSTEPAVEHPTASVMFNGQDLIVRGSSEVDTISIWSGSSAE